MAGTLILLCGLPGSGKTTTAKELETNRGAVRFSPDEEMAFYDECAVIRSA